jgi:hypothetical protein
LTRQAGGGWHLIHDCVGRRSRGVLAVLRRGSARAERRDDLHVAEAVHGWSWSNHPEKVWITMGPMQNSRQCDGALTGQEQVASSDAAHLGRRSRWARPTCPVGGEEVEGAEGERGNQPRCSRHTPHLILRGGSVLLHDAFHIHSQCKSSNERDPDRVASLWTVGRFAPCRLVGIGIIG